MAWRGHLSLSRSVKELQFIYCQTSPASLPAREFVHRNYKDLKILNPKLPSLIRKSSGVEPQLRARYGTRMSAVEREASFIVKKKAAVVSNELKGTSIFLVGMNCTVKTNLGKVLADVLKYYYFDSDSVVEQATTGASSAKSFQEKNDEKFRESEIEVLKQLSAMGRLVVCVGDGALQSSTNLAFLRDGISLWIDVPLDMLANEVLMAEVFSPELEIPPDDDQFLKMNNLTTRYNELKGGYGTADATVSLLKVASQLGYEDFNSVSGEDMAVQALKEIERLTRLKKMIEEAAKPFYLLEHVVFRAYS